MPKPEQDPEIDRDAEHKADMIQSAWYSLGSLESALLQQIAGTLHVEHVERMVQCAGRHDAISAGCCDLMEDVLAIIDRRLRFAPIDQEDSRLLTCLVRAMYRMLEIEEE